MPPKLNSAWLAYHYGQQHEASSGLFITINSFLAGSTLASISLTPQLPSQESLLQWSVAAGAVGFALFILAVVCLSVARLWDISFRTSLEFERDLDRWAAAARRNALEIGRAVADAAVSAKDGKEYAQASATFAAIMESRLESATVLTIADKALEGKKAAREAQSLPFVLGPIDAPPGTEEAVHHSSIYDSLQNRIWLEIGSPKARDKWVKKVEEKDYWKIRSSKTFAFFGRLFTCLGVIALLGSIALLIQVKIGKFASSWLSTIVTLLICVPSVCIIVVIGCLLYEVLCQTELTPLASNPQMK